MADNLADKIPKELKEAQSQGKLVVFVGAGASQPKPSDLPGFDRLCTLVAENFEVDQRGSDETPTAYLHNVARFVRDRKPDLKEFVRDQYMRKNSKPNKLHRLLIQLFPHDKELAIFTTNYDRHLVTAARAQERDPNVSSYPSRIPKTGFEGIYFLHGSVDQKAKYLVITETDFESAYLGVGSALDSLSEIFRDFTVLFFGYGLEDPFVDRLNRVLSAEKYPRFALVDSAKAERFKRLNVCPIEYQLISGNDPHAQAALILESWIDEIRQEEFAKSKISAFGG